MNEHHGPSESPADNGNEQEVSRLIEAAGPRSRLPEGDLAAIRAAAESVFEERYGGELPAASSSRLWLLAAAVAAVAISLGWWYATTRPGADAAKLAVVERIKGTVRVREDNGPAQSLAPGQEIAAGSVLSTGAGEASFATLRLRTGHSLRLGRGSRLRLWTTRLVELEEGALYVDSGAVAAPPVEVLTSLGTVTEIGTQFEVRLVDGDETALRVRVREGRVQVASEELAHTAEAGEELLLDLAGSVERRAVALYGEAWDWVVESAPGLDIGGRTATEVLEWLSRETGCDVRYESEELSLQVQDYKPFDSNLGEVRVDGAHQYLESMGLKADWVEGELRVQATDR